MILSSTKHTSLRCLLGARRTASVGNAKMHLTKNLSFHFLVPLTVFKEKINTSPKKKEVFLLLFIVRGLCGRSVGDAATAEFSGSVVAGPEVE